MSRTWWRLLLPPGIILLIALAFWPLAGALPASIFLSGGLVVVLAYHLYHIEAFKRWQQQAQIEALPHGLGLWEVIFAEMYRQLRAQSRSHRRLSAVLGRFRRAAEALPDGIVVIDQDERIEWCNPAAEAQLNVSSKRDHGQPITRLVRQPQFAAYLDTENYNEPLVLKALPPYDATLSIQLIAFGDRQKLLICRDITNLERVETMRRDFVANVSHELRTPLTVLGGFVETLCDLPQINAKQTRHYYGLMQEQTQRMQRLVEDLLTLSRLESASNTVDEKSVDIPALLTSLHEETRSLSAGKHQVNFSLGSRNGLLGNEHELRSALGNLLSNAVRYTPAGGTIEISWRDDEGQAIFSVRDSGEGIAPEHLHRLTERFYRVDRSRSRETGGTGLGLSIVKHVATRHQAQLLIESKPGAGSTFSMRFPAQRTLAPQHEALATVSVQQKSDESIL
ncbi:MAG: phosphate regulon sensor histidine kinase PhoR [Burkholderiales bacterium]